MQSLSTAPAIVEDMEETVRQREPAEAPVLDTPVPPPRRESSRLLAVLRAFVVLITGQYPDGDGLPRSGSGPGDRSAEMDSIVRLIRMGIFQPF